MENNLKCALTGKIIHQGEFNYHMQEFLLKRMESFINDDSDIESQFNCYRHGLIDGIKMALTLQK